MKSRTQRGRGLLLLYTYMCVQGGEVNIIDHKVRTHQIDVP